MGFLVFVVAGIIAKSIILRITQNLSYRVVAGTMASIVLGPILFRLLASDFSSRLNKIDLIVFIATLIGTYVADLGAWLFRKATAGPDTANLDPKPEKAPNAPATFKDRALSSLTLGAATFGGALIYTYAAERPWTSALQYGLWGLLMGAFIASSKAAAIKDNNNSETGNQP